MKHLTASDIRIGMSKRWAAPEWAIMWEVANSTGAGGSRYADAVMMSLWPSRGLELHGVEIKVSRSDWRNEAADPTKAEAIAKFCDRWWVHTSPGVVPDLSEVPPAWGLREFDGRAWRTIREAEKTEAQPVTRAFLASLLRRGHETMRRMVLDAAQEGRAHLEKEREELRKQYAEKVKRAVAERTAELAAAEKNLADFEAAFGDLRGRSWGDFSRFGAAALALSKLSDYNAGATARKLRGIAEEIEAVLALSNAKEDRPQEPPMITDRELEALARARAENRLAQQEDAT